MYSFTAIADFDIDNHDVHDLLPSKIVKEFLTLQTFVKTGAWMEKLKSSKKPTQRTRSLRSELCNMDAD